jgi:hypothetical protein
MSEQSMQSEAVTDLSVNPAEEVQAEQSISDAMNEKVAEESKSEEEVKSPEDANFAEKFAALSRKEKEFRARQKEVEAKYSEYEAWKKEQEELANQKEPEVPLEYRLKKNPLETLAELGLSYDKLTELALNDGKLTQDMQMELMRQEIENKYSRELEDIRNEILERDKKAEETKYQETIQNFMTELTDFVNTSEDYEMIRANDSVDLVYELIESHHAETGNILSNKEAADQVEEYLFEEAKKLYETNKLKGLYSKPEAPASEKRVESPTLSNDLGTQVSTQGSKYLSNDESKAAIARMLKWEE